MIKTVKNLICAFVLMMILSTVASASVNSEMSRYNNANEKQLSQMENSFKCQYKQFVDQKNVIVISSAANFETCNSVRSYTVLPDAKLRLTDYKGRTETVSVRELQNKYECYIMAKGMKVFNTDGSMSANFYAMRD